MRILATLLMLLCAVDAWAQTTPAEGEVRKIDKEAGKATIKHGPIPQLDMGPMTMVFRVKESAMLDRMQVGDRIRFTAEKIGGAITLTSVEVAK
jgi:Cu/Ag efflux protein CusF